LLSIDVEHERLSLGLKQLHPNPWEGIANTITVGDTVTGKVVRLTDFGAFIELNNGIEGLLHVSEISRQHVKKPEDVLSVGDDVTAKVIKLDEENRRIGLSIKAYEEEIGKGAEEEEGAAAEGESATPEAPETEARTEPETKVDVEPEAEVEGSEPKPEEAAQAVVEESETPSDEKFIETIPEEADAKKTDDKKQNEAVA
jgi:ribosomal protein S1